MKIHKTSIIEDGAKIGSNVSIGPYSHIGRNVVLGDNVVIQGYCEIGVHSFAGNKKPLEIGDNSLIRSKSIFYSGSTFGTNLITGHHVTVREGVKAGKEPLGLTVSNLLTMGFFGFIFGPALVGYSAEYLGLTFNMYILCLVWFLNSCLLIYIKK